MNKKRLRSILLTATLTVGLSFTASTDANAAEYTAVSGDTLYKISKAYNTSVANIMVANNFTDYNINIGQIIHVPCEKYTVVKGDTLFKISQKYNISLFKLRQANNIFTNYIYVGQVLDIPLTAPLELKIEEPQVEAPVQEAAPVKNEPTPSEIVQPAPFVEAPTQEQEPATPYSNEELDLLARLIMAETEGQPYEAMVAVGSVVMNRVESGLFAPTITEVINQKIDGYYQFTPVQNGWINRPASEESIRAAKEALSGVDTTDGAIWYYDDSTTNQWILSKTVSVQYGNMIYAYK
ncbi:MAG: LysM peptidoglycan-binding domain-containing protein [Sedimentibacter sp.]